MARVDVVHGPTIARPEPKRRLHLHRSPRPVVVAPTVAEERTATVGHISLWSVTRMALAFWTGIGIFLAVTALVLWGMLSAMGIIDNIESFIAQLTDESQFHVVWSDVFVVGTLVLVAFVCIATVITVAMAAFYNLLAYITGGCEIDLRKTEREVDQQAGASVRSSGHADDTVVL